MWHQVPQVRTREGRSHSHSHTHSHTLSLTHSFSLSHTHIDAHTQTGAYKRGAIRGRETCFRAKWEQFKRFQGLRPEGQGRNLALTVLHVPSRPAGAYERGAIQPHSLSLSLPLTHTHTHTSILSRTLTHSLAHSPTHTLTHTHT